MRKKSLIFCLIFLINYLAGFAQKSVIDTDAINKWGHLDQGILSGDGKYFAYSTILNSDYQNNVLTIEYVKQLKKIAEFNYVTSFNFAADQHLAIFIKSEDNLTFFHLKSRSTDCVPGVNSYQLSPGKKWIAYQTTGAIK